MICTSSSTVDAYAIMISVNSATKLFEYINLCLCICEVMSFFSQTCFLTSKCSIFQLMMCNSSFSPIAISRMMMMMKKIKFSIQKKREKMTSSNLAYLFQWFEQDVFSMACFIICEVHLGLQSDLNLYWSESIFIWIYRNTLTDAVHSSGSMFYGLQHQLL